jgi:hypothetical protein
MHFAPTVASINLVALIFYSPVLLLRKPVSLDDGSGKYALVLTALSQSRFGQIIPILLSLIRLVLIKVVLFGINLTVLIIFKRHIGQKMLIAKNSNE